MLDGSVRGSAGAEAVLRTSSVGVGDQIDYFVTDVVCEDVFVLQSALIPKILKSRKELTLEKVLIVFVYSFNRFVDQDGDDRSMEPFNGSETSSLRISCILEYLL
jgi:hypothetical protein